MAEGVDKAKQHKYEEVEVICGICQEKPCHLKLLSCYHAYCSTCLDRYIDNNCEHGNVRCPLCRGLIEITSEGALIGVTDLFVKIISDKVAMCEICETSESVSFCIECTQNYCRSCAEMHSKIKLNREHHIVPNGMAPLQNKQKSATFCTKHESELLTYFCLDCKEPICLKCNMTKHKSHGCEDIAFLADSKRKYLEQEILGQVTCRVMILEERLQKCKYKKQHIEDECKKETEMMRDHVTRLKTRIDEQMKALASNLWENVEKYVQVIQNQEGVLEKELRALKAKSCYIQQCVDLAGDAELINILPGLEDGPFIRDGSVWLEESGNIKYTPPDLSIDQINNMIGAPSLKLSSSTKFTKLSEFGVDNTIKGICLISPDAVWVAHGKCVQKVTKREGVCDRVDIREHVYDVVNDVDGKAYVACQHSIRLVNADLGVVKCFDLPFCPSGIAVSDDGKICVCFKYAGMINLYSKEGKRYLELHKDSCQGMPVAPVKVAIHLQQIYVTDHDSLRDITVISFEGCVKYKFKHGNMDPRGLIISRQGYIFVIDKRNKCINLFNQQGICIDTLNVNLGFMNVLVVSENDLWIGDTCNRMHVLRFLV